MNAITFFNALFYLMTDLLVVATTAFMITLVIFLFQNYRHAKRQNTYAWMLKPGKRTMIFGEEYVYQNWPNMVIVADVLRKCNNSIRVWMFVTQDEELTPETKLYCSEFPNQGITRFCLGRDFRIQNMKDIIEINEHIVNSKWNWHDKPWRLSKEKHFEYLSFSQTLSQWLNKLDISQRVKYVDLKKESL